MAAASNDSLLVSSAPGHIVYHNLQLDTSKKEVRLLEILPGSGQEPVVCALLCAALGSDLSYVALSYTWAMSAPLLGVSINGLDFPIRRNLYAALQQIRRPSSPVRLWVDAVCINQASIPERSAQVPLMREIYSTASQVLIWLGEGDEATDHAVEALHQLVGLRTDGKGVLDNLDVLLPEEMQASDFPTEKRSERMRSIKAGLNDIFTRPWWDRTWTVQELALARDRPLLTCETSSICFACFMQAYRELDVYLSKTNRADEGSDFWILSGVQSALTSRKPYSLDSIRNYTQAAKQLWGERINSYLARLLAYTQHSRCTDPRDKVYGLLGMAEPEALEAIRIDYEISVLEVYTRTTTYLILRDGFQILSTQGIWPQREGWPSWVVDFLRSPPQNYETLIRGYDQRGAKYCPLPYRGLETPARFLPDGIFRVSAISIDLIVETSPIWRAGEPSGSLGWFKLKLRSDAFHVFLKAARPCLDCASKDEQDSCSHPSYKPLNSASAPQPLGNAVCRTLVADWIDPTKGYVDRPPGPISPSHLGTLNRVINDTIDDREVLAALDIAPTDEHPSLSQISLVAERLTKISSGRVAFRTARGWIGTGTYDAKAGDAVIAVVGADVPYVIRPSDIDTDARVRLVGECYVDGIMFAECTRNPYFRLEGDMNQAVQLYPFDLR